MSMNTAFVLRVLKGSGRLLLNTVGDTVWATDSYWALEVPNDKHPIAQILADYNLPLAPAVCEVGKTVKLQNGTDPPNLADLLSKFPIPSDPLKPATIGDQPLYANSGFDTYQGQKAALFQHPNGSYQAFSEVFLVSSTTHMAGWAAVPSWRHSPPAGASDESRSVKALLMPVRLPLMAAANWKTPAKKDKKRAA